MIFSFFKPKIVVIFHMKSGAELKFKCRELETQINRMNEITSYSMKGLKNPIAHYIRIDDISAIQVRK